MELVTVAVLIYTYIRKVHDSLFGQDWLFFLFFTPRTLYSRGKSPRYPLDRRLGGPQSRSGRFGEEKILDPTGTLNPLVVQPVSSRYTDYAIPAPHWTLYRPDIDIDIKWITKKSQLLHKRFTNDMKWTNWFNCSFNETYIQWQELGSSLRNAGCCLLFFISVKVSCLATCWLQLFVVF
jgi:hypothetical protein